MADTFRLEIVTPERQLLDADVEELRVPSVDGEVGVLPGHARMMTVLGVGELAYRRRGEWTRLAVASGFVEVQSGRVIVLAQTAEEAADIDVERARAARQRAEERLASPDPDTELERARDALARADARLQVAERAAAGAGVEHG